MINGIDISNPTRNFTDQEWDALGPNGGRAIVQQMRDRVNGRGRGRGGRSGGRGDDGNRNVGAVNRDEAQCEQNDDASQASERGSRNGNNFGRGRYQQQNPQN